MYNKEPQTGKKTVTADDLKPGMYFRFRHESPGLRQLVENRGTEGPKFFVVDEHGKTVHNARTLVELADHAFRDDGGMYLLLDEQPVLSFPAKVNPDPIPEPAPRAASIMFDIFAAPYGKQTFQFAEVPEPTVTEIQLADGTSIVITTPGK